MICEIVRFKVRPGTTRTEVLDDARTTIPKWRAEPALVRKHFLFDGEGEALGVYLWTSRAAAEAAHDEAWRERIRSAHGSEPEIAYYDTVMILDNEADTVREY